MIIRSKIIPIKGFAAMAIFPFIFVRGDKKLSTKTLNHEWIHFSQQKELLIIPFYLIYFIFWLIYGYKEMPFEKEAYKNSSDENYLKNRKLYSWIKYI